MSTLMPELGPVIEQMSRRIYTLEQRITSPDYVVPNGSAPTFTQIKIGTPGQTPDAVLTTTVAPATGLTLGSVSNMSDVRITASWTASPDAREYEVRWYLKSVNGSTYTLVNFARTVGTSYVISGGLLPGRVYGVRVYAVNSLGVLSNPVPSTNFTDVTVATDATVPGTLVNLIGRAGATSITLMWDESTEDDVKFGGYYQVQVSTNADYSNPLFDQDTTASIVSFTGLATGTPHYSRVRGVDASGNVGPWSNFAALTPAAAGGTPAPGSITDDMIASSGFSAANIKFGAMSGDRISAKTLDVNVLKTSTFTGSTITLASGGAIVGGSAPLGPISTGFILTENGFALNKNGDPTVSFDALTGNASFKGDLTGASGTFSGTVSGASIVGSSFATSQSGDRLTIDATLGLRVLYNGATNYAAFPEAGASYTTAATYNEQQPVDYVFGPHASTLGVNLLNSQLAAGGEWTGDASFVNPEGALAAPNVTYLASAANARYGGQGVFAITAPTSIVADYGVSVGGSIAYGSVGVLPGLRYYFQAALRFVSGISTAWRVELQWLDYNNNVISTSTSANFTPTSLSFANNPATSVPSTFDPVTIKHNAVAPSGAVYVKVRLMTSTRPTTQTVHYLDALYLQHDMPYRRWASSQYIDALTATTNGVIHSYTDVGMWGAVATADSTRAFVAGTTSTKLTIPNWTASALRSIASAELTVNGRMLYNGSGPLRDQPITLSAKVYGTTIPAGVTLQLRHYISVHAYQDNMGLGNLNMATVAYDAQKIYGPWFTVTASQWADMRTTLYPPDVIGGGWSYGLELNPYTVNQVTNGDFETGALGAGWDAAYEVSGSYAAASVRAADNTQNIVNRQYRNRQYYSLYMGNPNGAGSATATNSIAVTAGQVWKIGTWGMSTANATGGFYLRVLFGTTSGFTRAASTSNVDIIGNGTLSYATWQYYSGTVTVPAGATWMRVAVYNWLTPAGTNFMFDNISATLNVADAVVNLDNYVVHRGLPRAQTFYDAKPLVTDLRGGFDRYQNGWATQPGSGVYATNVWEYVWQEFVPPAAGGPMTFSVDLAAYVAGYVNGTNVTSSTIGAMDARLALQVVPGGTPATDPVTDLTGAVTPANMYTGVSGLSADPVDETMWKRYSVTATIPANTAAVRACIAVRQPTPGYTGTSVDTLRHRHWQIESASVATPYFTGDSPGATWSGVEQASSSVRPTDTVMSSLSFVGSSRLTGTLLGGALDYVQMPLILTDADVWAKSRARSSLAHVQIGGKHVSRYVANQTSFKQIVNDAGRISLYPAGGTYDQYYAITQMYAKASTALRASDRASTFVYTTTIDGGAPAVHDIGNTNQDIRPRLRLVGGINPLSTTDNTYLNEAPNRTTALLSASDVGEATVHGGVVHLVSTAATNDGTSISTASGINSPAGILLESSGRGIQMEGGTASLTFGDHPSTRTYRSAMRITSTYPTFIIVPQGNAYGTGITALSTGIAAVYETGQYAYLYSNGSQVASSTKFKTDVADPEVSAAQHIRNAPVKMWSYKSDRSRRHLGPMAEDLPDFMLSETDQGTFVDLRSMVGVLWQHAAEQTSKIEDLERQIAALSPRRPK